MDREDEQGLWLLGTELSRSGEGGRVLLELLMIDERKWKAEQAFLEPALGSFVQIPGFLLVLLTIFLEPQR